MSNTALSFKRPGLGNGDRYNSVRRGICSLLTEAFAEDVVQWKLGSRGFAQAIVAGRDGGGRPSGWRSRSVKGRREDRPDIPYVSWDFSFSMCFMSSSSSARPVK